MTGTILWPTILLILQCLAIILPVLVAVAWLTWAERKVLGAIRMRQGPSVAGPFGLLQPVADGFKLLGKEMIVPDGADRMLFIGAPILTFTLSLVAWAVIPFDSGWVLAADINVALLYVLAILSLGVYGAILSGWASNSKYAFLNGMRQATQMIVYEISIGLVIVAVLLTAGSLDLSDIVMAPMPWWLWLLLTPMMAVFFVSILAVTNRSPFDLSEDGSELAGGIHVEYSAMPLALFLIGKYANMMLMSALMVVLFFGGWLPPLGFIGTPLDLVPGVVWFAVKTALVLFCFLWTRGTLPRLRYDQIIKLGWKVFLPFSLAWVVVVAAALLATHSLPGGG